MERVPDMSGLFHAFKNTLWFKTTTWGRLYIHSWVFSMYNSLTSSYCTCISFLVALQLGVRLTFMYATLHHTLETCARSDVAYKLGGKVAHPLPGRFGYTTSRLEGSREVPAPGGTSRAN